jgi:hypothetical protein
MLVVSDSAGISCAVEADLSLHNDSLFPHISAAVQGVRFIHNLPMATTSSARALLLAFKPYVT